MESWLWIILISAFLVGLVAYFLWRQFFMRPADASEVGAAGTAPDFYERKPGTQDPERRASESTRRRADEEHSRGTEQPGPPLS